MAFRRPKNLKDYLVRARLSKEESVNDRGTAKCDNGRCQIVKTILLYRFLSFKTNKSCSNNYGLNGNSTIVVYLLSCRVCGLQYVGSTIVPFTF